MRITKKIWPEYFDAILSGKKKFELRLGDLGAKEADTLVLEAWDPQDKKYTGRAVEKKVTYVLTVILDELFWPKEEIEEKGISIVSLE